MSASGIGSLMIILLTVRKARKLWNIVNWDRSPYLAL